MILEEPSLLNEDKKFYQQKRKLKQTKFEHVMALAENYVPQCTFWLYQDIQNYHKGCVRDFSFVCTIADFVTLTIIFHKNCAKTSKSVGFLLISFACFYCGAPNFQ